MSLPEKMRCNLSVTYKDGEVFTEVKIPLFVPQEKENADQNYHSSSADRGLFLTAGRGIPEICSFYDPISGHRL